MLPTGLSGCVHPRRTQYEQSSVVSAFTLIELLIVIAIVLILISIAMPNFMEAQLRAKVIKAKGELRCLGTALEEYFQDFKVYPPLHDGQLRHVGTDGRNWGTGLFSMTSPIKYLPSIPLDPFHDRFNSTYLLNGIRAMHGRTETSLTTTWFLRSCGPDCSCYFISPYEPLNQSGERGCLRSYCPTNGTRSDGEIFYWGGDPFWIGTRLHTADMTYYRRLINGGCEGDAWLCLDDVNYLHTMPPSLR